MTTYLLLLRGINVGGKNKVPMAQLRDCLGELGFERVETYIASGNVIVDSDKASIEVANLVETALPEAFALDSELVKVHVLTTKQLAALVAKKPAGFGDQPDLYYCDAIFLMGLQSSEVMPLFNPREGVDRVWPGEAVVYSERLGAERTKSRLSVIVGTPAYKNMTIRSWNTVVKLLAIMQAR